MHNLRTCRWSSAELLTVVNTHHKLSIYLVQCMKMITNIGLGFKLINSTSFGESVFSAGYIQKTVNGDLNIRINHTYPRWNQHQKLLEDNIGQSTMVEAKGLLGGVGRPYPQGGWPMGPPSQPPLRMSVLHHFLDCIYVVLFKLVWSKDLKLMLTPIYTTLYPL